MGMARRPTTLLSSDGGRDAQTMRSGAQGVRDRSSALRGFVLRCAIVSYLFAAYLYDKRRFNVKPIVDLWSDVEPAFAGEQLVRVAVSPRVEAVFYFSGAFSTKSRAFFAACEPLLLDGYAEGPAEALRERGERKFKYAVWLSSDMFDYDISMLFSGDDFEGRAIIEGRGERVSVEGGGVKGYELAPLQFVPRELGLVDEKTGHFDEDAFERIVAEREEPFRPGLLVHDEIGVTRGKVIDALHHAWNDQGEVVWPPGGPKDTPELRQAIADATNPTILGLPLWDYLAQQAPPSMPPSSGHKKKKKKK